MQGQVEIRPRLVGGSEGVKILCTNSNGYPSDKNNKRKVPTAKKLLKDQDMAIILETGINKVQTMLDLDESLNIAKSNPMKSIERN